MARAEWGRLKQSGEKEGWAMGWEKAQRQAGFLGGHEKNDGEELQGS